jgi:hypothetical protein
MNKRPMIAAITGALILILIAIGIQFAWRRPVISSTPVSNPSDAGTAGAKAGGVGAAVAGASVKSVPTGGMWTRPSASAAARNVRRSRLAVTLRPLGAGDTLIARLADGDILAAVTELKQQAQSGDATAANVLEYMAHFTCAFAGIDGETSEYARKQNLDAQGLPAADVDWAMVTMREEAAYNKRLSSVCQQTLDKKEIDQWVTASAARGDPASHYLLSIFGAPKARDEQLRDAAAAGYPWGEDTLASRMMSGDPIVSGSTDTPQNAADLLRAAALVLPAAESQLAICEFNGCPGIDPDLTAAVTHAREAAQKGTFAAMIEIGPQLQASQIDPDEVAAWNLVYAALEQQGCAGQAINATLTKSVSYSLNSPTVSTNIKTLAESYWKDYGTTMLSNLGCAS